MLNNDVHGSSIVAHLLTLLDRYGLLDFVKTYKHSGTFPDKATWKKRVVDSLIQHERDLYHQRTSTDSDFSRFSKVHPDCFTPSLAWVAASEIPRSLELFSFLVKLTVEIPTQYEVTLCESCGLLFNDTLQHRVTSCCRFSSERESFWTFITDNFPIDVHVALHNMEDDELIEAMLGAPTVFVENTLKDNTYWIFMYRCAVYLYSITKQ